MTALNLARRKLYDSLESQLTSQGLSVGKDGRALSIYTFNSAGPICHAFLDLEAPSRSTRRERPIGITATPSL